MKYIITGGAGFIGSHLIESLIEKDIQVLCIDNLSSGFMANIPSHKNVKVIKKSMQDITMDRIGDVDGIFHLAAQASVPKSIEDFYNSSSNNLLSTLKVWDWANKLHIPIVYASSSAIYGNLPLGDDQINKYDILSPYAQDKLTMEYYAKMAWRVYKTKSIGLRFFNVYGPRQDPTNPYSGVISIFIERLMNNLPVTVNGGYQTRDFVYVSDIVDTLIKSMYYLHKNNICDVFNVGTGKSVTIDSLLEIIAGIFNKKPEVIKAKLPFGDPEKSEGIYKKLENSLRISVSKFITLETGLKETIEYNLK